VERRRGDGVFFWQDEDEDEEGEEMEDDEEDEEEEEEEKAKAPVAPRKAQDKKAQRKMAKKVRVGPRVEEGIGYVVFSTKHLNSIHYMRCTTASVVLYTYACMNRRLGVSAFIRGANRGDSPRRPHAAEAW
jgi:hypothetical protein